MNDAHSPGPWRWVTERVDGGSDTRAHLVDAHGESVMLAYNPADAAIMAAAPEMLAMLRRIHHGSDNCTLCQAPRGSDHYRDCPVGSLLARLPPAPTP